MGVMAGSEFTCKEEDDRFLLRCAGVRVTFVRSGDRWTHRAAFGEESSGDLHLAEIVATIEGDPTRDDPDRVISPVYQDIQRHEFAGDQVRGICLLLTGQSFLHHFSAAVSLFRDTDSPRFLVIDVDIADRCRSPVSFLAASYLVRLGSSDLLSASPHEIAWAGPTLGDGRLELECDLPANLAMDEGGRSAMRVQVLARIDPDSSTQRLRYRWRWDSCGQITE
jgi:hypothetical protein